MANPPKLLSGRVPVVPLDQLSNTRYQFLGLNEAEPNLGNGVANSILTIQTDGTRIWANTINVTTANFSGNVVGTTFYGNFVGNITANANANAFISAPGANTEVLFNNQGNIGANANLTFDVSQALLTTGNLSVLGQVSAQFGSFSETVSANNITVGNQISAATGSFANVSVSSNISGGNLAVTGLITATGNITGGNIDAANLIYSAGNVSAAGNILGGNILATNMVSATGNIFGNYITAAQNVAVLGNKITSGTSTGIVFSAGNTSLFSSNLIIDGGYIYSINGDPEIKLSYNGEIGSVGIFNNLYLGANGTGNLTVPGTSNLWGQVYSNSTITAAGNLTANSVTANLEIVATGNITGGNIITSGFVTATGNIQSSANLVAPRVVTSNIATSNNSLTISTDADFNINIHPSGNGTVDLNDHRITNLGTPSLPDDAVTKEYVDTQTSTGLHIHQPVKWLETGNLTATYANGGTSVTVDSISGNKTLTFTTSPGLAVDDLIVFTNSFNGITGGTPYFVYSSNGTNQITLKATILGVEITTLTNGGPGLAQAGLVNSGVGATLTNAGANAAFVPSGSNVAASVNDRILVINQANGAFNGVYSVTTVGNAIAQWVFTRATDEDTYDPANTSAASAGDYVLVTDGDSSGDSYVLTDPTGPIVFGTSNIQFTLFSSVPSYTGANGVAVTGLTISANVDNITTAITNGNIVVKDSAVFTTPNIGAATGISLSVTGNLTANNLSLTTSLSGNIANFAGNVSAGNLISLGVVSASGNISGGNLYIANESNLAGNLHALGNSHFGQPLTFAASGANIQYAGTANSYLQLIVQNKDNGAAASTDFVATADNGTDNDTYIDMGINSSAYNQAGYELTGANDGYLYVYGNTTTGGGNLVLATYTAKDIIFATGGLANANLAAKFQHGNGLSVAGNVYAPWFIGNVGGNASNIIVQGPNTGVVFNDDSSANSTLGFTFDKSSNSVVVAGNLTANNLSATSNISGNNLNLTGALTSGNLNISNSNISTTGNITANYFLGNGSLLTGIVTSVSNIFNGNTNVRIDTTNGNVAANVAGTANVLVLANTGAYVNGEVSVNGNVTGNYFYGNGYFLTGVSVDTTRIYNGNSNVRIDTTSGNIQANVAGTANVLTIANTGVYTTNVFANTVSASGNVTGAYFIGNGSQLTGVVNATVSNSPPAFPDQGDIWINSDTGIQYIYFTASGNSQWAEMEADVSFSSSTGGGNGNVDFTSISSNVLPSANITYNLGNATNRWNDIWLANSTIYLGAANISSQGPNLVLPNVVILGNVILDASTGNLDIPGELVTNSEILLSNTVSSNIVGAGNFLITQNNGKYISINSQMYSQLYWTSNIANLDVGGNDSYAWVYVHQDGVYIETNPISGNQHQWTFRANGVIDTTYDLTTTGNVVVDYIESMSDVIANANVTASGNISATGNVLAGANIWANGNIFATTVFANLSACSFVYGNTVTANAELFLNANANLYFSYESDSPANLYTWIVSANTEGIYAVGGGNASGGGTTYEVANAYGNINGSNVNALFANVIGNVDAGAVSVSGNITANYYIGDGSALTGIPPGYSNANVDSYLPVYSGNISAGNISVTSAVAAATLSGNGAALTALTFGNITDITTANLTVDDIYLQGSTRLNVTSSGVSGYIFDQYGNSLNPTLYLTSGETVAFNLYHAGHPFLIQTSGGANYSNGLIHVTTSGVATTGASAQGQINGTLYWKVPYGISGQYRYICQAHSGMNGNIIINDANSGNIVSNVVVSTTGFMQLPVGNTAQRPSSPAAGMVRYNSQIGEPEWYDPAGNQWLKFSQAAQYNVDFLIVAGGGAGGGYDVGGGGGAGGLIASSTTVNPGTVYNVVVGAGGTVPGRAGQGGDGGNSSVFSNTAVGGGGGSAGNSGGTTVGRPGGSGGGGSWSTTAGTGTVGQGYDGGVGVPTGGAASGGGGGGAGGVGIAGGVAGTSRGGAGGPGYTWVNGSTYAGGGGGGSDTSYNAPGGSSIGGQGGTTGGGGGNGTASTGSGGGGGGGFGGQAGGTGGGGIVIVRYSGTQRGSGGTVTSAGGYTYHTFTGSGTFTA